MSIMSQPPIWYIHGAFASSRSFSWINDQLPKHDSVNVEYSCGDDLNATIDDLVQRANEAGPIDIIGHSLGGVIGVILSRRCPNVRKVVTMSAPFGGSRVAAFLQFLTPGTFMSSIRPYSPVMIEAREGPLTVPVMSIVTTGGETLKSLPVSENDGVVSLQSQRALGGAQYIDLPINHFEVLLAKETPSLIQSFLW